MNDSNKHRRCLSEWTTYVRVSLTLHTIVWPKGRVLEIQKNLAGNHQIIIKTGSIKTLWDFLQGKYGKFVSFALFYMFRVIILKFLKCHSNKYNFVTLTITLYTDFIVLTNTHQFF
jgi:hypothetical protein